MHIHTCTHDNVVNPLWADATIVDHRFVDLATIDEVVNIEYLLTIYKIFPREVISS